EPDTCVAASIDPQLVEQVPLLVEGTKRSFEPLPLQAKSALARSTQTRAPELRETPDIARILVTPRSGYNTRLELLSAHAWNFSGETQANSTLTCSCRYVSYGA